MSELRRRDAIRVEPVLFVPDGDVPNNPRLPLLVYYGVVEARIAGQPEACARTFEARFAEHGWPGAWRDGLFAFHHYHSGAHEVLGIYQGEADIMFGGPGGQMLRVAAGDMVVVPAGVAHKKMAARGCLGVVGAYPAGQSPDLCCPGRRPGRTREVALPVSDPAYGPTGPLLQYWA